MHCLYFLASQVFTREELQVIADLCIKHDTLCISDEVYEWLVYKGNKHIKIGTYLFFCDVIEAAVELCCKLTPKITFAGGSSNFKLFLSYNLKSSDKRNSISEGSSGSITVEIDSYKNEKEVISKWPWNAY